MRYLVFLMFVANVGLFAWYRWGVVPPVLEPVAPPGIASLELVESQALTGLTVVPSTAPPVDVVLPNFGGNGGL